MSNISHEDQYSIEGDSSSCDNQIENLSFSAFCFLRKLYVLA